jgi:signal transduction histidine kinase
MSLADDNAKTADPPTRTTVTATTSGLPLVQSPYSALTGSHDQSLARNRMSVEPCRQAWERIRALDPSIFQTLPVSPHVEEDEGASALLHPVHSQAQLHTDIVLQVELALQDGIRPSTCLALTMLGALAVEHFDGGEPAVRLTQVAVDLAARVGGPQADQVRVLHAALVLPLLGRPHEAAHTLALLGKSDNTASLAGLPLAGVGFATGMELSLLTQHLDRARRVQIITGSFNASTIELAARMSLLRKLLAPEPARTVGDLGLGNAAGQEQRFGYWLNRLQTAWYAGDRSAACHAATKATALLQPLTPASDRLICHTFSALALSRSGDTSTIGLMHFHTAALRRLSRLCPDSEVMAELADAACAYLRGDACAALRGFEAAAASAAGRSLHWLAALAWEQAAVQSTEAGFPSAAWHYQQQALESYQQWGASGRIDTLRRIWNVTDVQTAEAVPERTSPTQGGPASEFGLSIAHEVNQPLAAITLHAAAARKWLRRPVPDIDRALASLSLISAAGRQAGGIVRSIQRLATHQEIEMGEVCVDEAIAEALQLLQRRLDKHGIEIDLALGLGERTIRANRVQLQQVVTNLVVNAIEALAETLRNPLQRRIRIESRTDGNQQVEIAIADNGAGIKPADRDLMFGSLFSTKPKNTGMGLSISLAIVRAHGGMIEFEPCVPHGACFRFCLPVDGKSAGIALSA